MMPCDLERHGEARSSIVQLPQLQLDAFSNGARADSRRIERLNLLQNSLNLLDFALDLRAKRCCNLFQRFGQIAVIADGIDDCARDRKLARLKTRKLELPQQ